MFYRAEKGCCVVVFIKIESVDRLAVECYLLVETFLTLSIREDILLQEFIENKNSQFRARFTHGCL